MSEFYRGHLESPKWQQIRDWVLWRDGYVCQDCGSRYGLEIHHMTYARTGNEPHTDLITVCRQHHHERNTYWWTRVPGGGRRGRDFTFDWLGSQTEWRMQSWVKAAGPVQRFREEAWFADRALQDEYASALARTGQEAVPGRPVRVAGRQLQPPAAAAIPARSFSEELEAFIPTPRSPRPRRRVKRVLVTVVALATFAGVLAVAGTWQSPTAPPNPMPTPSHTQLHRR